MMKNNFIYESPDKGKTIFARRWHRLHEKLMISANSESKGIEKLFLWQEILEAAETNPTLKDLVEKTEAVYMLLKNENQKK